MPQTKPAGKGGKKVLGLNKWAWAGVIALGVVVFIYFRHRASSAGASMSGNADANNGALDEGQLASDIGAQVAASLGGTPGGDTGGFDASWLADLLSQNEQSLEDFIANSPGYYGSGVGAPSSSVSPPTVPATGGASNGNTVATALATSTNGGVVDFTPPPPVAPRESVDSLSQGGVQITPGTVVTAPNPGAGQGDVSSGIAGLGGYVPPSGYQTQTPYVPPNAGTVKAV